MVPTVQALWESVLALGIVPATLVAYWDCAEHLSHAVRDVERKQEEKHEAPAVGVRYRHNPVKTHKVEGGGPLV